ncbi:hypothetical protein Tco_0160111, partial [Tanacetum coccineum]
IVKEGAWLCYRKGRQRHRMAKRGVFTVPLCKNSESYLRDPLVRVEEAMSLDPYQTDCMSARIPPERLPLLIGYELDQNHSQRHKE